MTKAVFLIPVDEDRKHIFESSGLETVFTAAEEVTDEMLKDAEIIFGNMDPEKIRRIPTIRWVQLASAGADRYVSLPQNILLTNCSGAYGEAISEHMLACVLAACKNLYRYHSLQQEHAWNNLGSVPILRNLKILSVGMGDIGTEFGKKMALLGSTVYGVRRTVHDRPCFVKKMYTMDDMDQILPECDVVALSLPETTETEGMFDYERLASMKKGAILLNVGRGSAIVTEDLIRIMKERHLSAACLDVTDHEPLPKNNPLWNTPNVYITPHISGRFNAAVTYDRVLDIFADNLQHYLHGEPLSHIVDRTKGY